MPGSYLLAANSPGINETGHWAIVGANMGVSISDATSPTSTITLAETTSGSAKLQWTITNSNGCFSYDTVTVTNLGGEMPVDAGADQTLGHCYSATQSTFLSGSYAGSGIDGQQGTWTVVSGTNVPNINDIHNNLTSVSNLIEGVYVFQWDVTGVCVSGSDQVTVTVPPPTPDVTDAGGTVQNLNFCDGRTEIVLEGIAPLYTGETGEWSQVSGPGGATIVNPTNPITSVTGLDGTSNYTFLYKITNGATNCESHAGVNVHYSAPPTIDITSDEIDLACGTKQTTIAYNSTGGGALTWQIISGPVTAEHPVIPTPEYAVITNPLIVGGLSEGGVYIIQMHKAAAIGTTCDDAYDRVAVIASRPADGANAGTDQLLSCHIDTSTLVGNIPVSGIGTWSQVSVPNIATIVDSHESSTVIRDLENGTYVFRWTTSNGLFCGQNEDDVNVVVADVIPVTVDAGPDQTVCINTPVYLDGNYPAHNEWGRWIITPNTGITISDDSDPKATVTGMVANSTYTLEWYMYNMCDTIVDTMIVTTNDTQGPIVADAGGDNCLASGTTTFNLDGNDPSPGTGVWTVVSGPNTPTITDNTLYNTSVTGAVDGTYRFEWAISSGGGCLPTLDTVIITIAPEATTADAGPDQSICGTAGNISVTMAANTPTQGVGKWVQVSGSGGVVIDDDTIPTTSMSGFIEGNFQFAWVISETNSGIAHNFDDVEGIKSTLENYFNRFLAGELKAESNSCEKYSRKNLAKNFVELIDRK